MQTVKEVLALLGRLLVAWVLLALYEALPHTTPLIGKYTRWWTRKRVHHYERE